MNEGTGPAAPRLYVVVPTASHAAGELTDVLRTVAAAAVLLPLGDADEPAMIEQVKRIAGPLVRDPGDRPHVQHGVAVIDAREVCGVARERPGVNRGQDHEHDGHQEVRRGTTKSRAQSPRE